MFSKSDYDDFLKSSLYFNLWGLVAIVGWSIFLGYLISVIWLGVFHAVLNTILLILRNKLTQTKVRGK